MVIAERRLRQLRREELRRVDLARWSRRSLGQWVTRPHALPRWMALSLAVAWVAYLPAAYALEPAPASRGAAPGWAVVLELVFTAALVATAMGLAARQRLGALASAGAAGLALVASVMCPVSGHHADAGAWWFAQMGGFLALGGLSLAGLRAARR